MLLKSVLTLEGIEVLILLPFWFILETGLLLLRLGAFLTCKLIISGTFFYSLKAYSRFWVFIVFKTVRLCFTSKLCFYFTGKFVSNYRIGLISWLYLMSLFFKKGVLTFFWFLLGIGFESQSLQIATSSSSLVRHSEDDELISNYEFYFFSLFEN